MLVCTTWKSRPLSPEAAGRMMDVWTKTEALHHETSASNEVAWYMYTDGSGGISITEVDDIEAATAVGLEIALALGEFLELDSRIVVEKESAMPAILGALSLTSGS